jgi:hypothetical protein
MRAAYEARCQRFIRAQPWLKSRLTGYVLPTKYRRIFTRTVGDAFAYT